jgi:hypothetical protein
MITADTEFYTNVYGGVQYADITALLTRAANIIDTAVFIDESLLTDVQIDYVKRRSARKRSTSAHRAAYLPLLPLRPVAVVLRSANSPSQLPRQARQELPPHRVRYPVTLRTHISKEPASHTGGSV